MAEQKTNEQYLQELNSKNALLSKYKSLLTRSKQSLEDKSELLAERNARIAELEDEVRRARQEEGGSPSFSGSEKTAEGSSMDGASGMDVPVGILRRVDDGSTVWLYIDFVTTESSSSSRRWVKFPSTEAADRFTSSFHGDPLPIPLPSVTEDEMKVHLEDTQARLERVTAEYQTYRIKAEIALRQRDLHHRHYARSVDLQEQEQAGRGERNGRKEDERKEGRESSSSPSPLLSRHSSSSDPRAGRSTRGYSHEQDPYVAKLSEELSALQARADQLASENEVLRSRHGDSVLAQEWRHRFEQSLEERETLEEKLRYYEEQFEQQQENQRSHIGQITNIDRSSSHFSSPQQARFQSIRELFIKLITSADISEKSQIEKAMRLMMGIRDQDLSA